MKKLFDNYDPEIRPVFKKSDTVTVKFGVSLFQIITVVSEGTISRPDEC